MPTAHSCNSDRLVPVDSVIPLLVGKRIEQRFLQNDMPMTYYGRVISQVPGFPEWYNVVYDDEPETVFTYKLSEDYKNGDMKLIL